MASVNPLAGGDSAGDVSPTGNSGAINPKMRKRTKTGCLTCRKRRIKCGEERPTCANCIKSKRQCEGYNQRVVFKPPIGDWPNHPGVVSTLQYHSGMLPGSRPAGFRPAQSAPQTQESSLSSIQPRRLTQFEYSTETGPTLGHLNTQQPFGGSSQPYSSEPNFQHPLQSPHHQQPLHSPHHQIPTPTSATSYFPQSSPVHSNYQGHYTTESNVGYQDPQRYSHGHYQHVPVSYDTQIDQKPTVSQASQDQAYYQQHQPATTRSEEQSSYVPRSNISPPTEDYSHFAEHRSSLPRYGSHPQVPPHQPQVSPTDFSHGGAYTVPLAVSHADPHSHFQPVQIPRHDMTSDVKYMPQHAVYGMSRV